MTRRGKSITTYSGRKFWPLDPRPEDVWLDDVAHALSLICRFTGHVSRFYSVAEHCLNVSRLVPRKFALEGLLHDAAEAYVADVSSPVKHSAAFAEYRRIEANLQAVVLMALGCEAELPNVIHQVDQDLGALEARLLFRNPPDWLGEVRELSGASIVGLPPRQAEELFLQRFREVRR